MGVITDHDDFGIFDVLEGLELARYNLHIKQKEITHNSHTESIESNMEMQSPLPIV